MITEFTRNDPTGRLVWKIRTKFENSQSRGSTLSWPLVTVVSEDSAMEMTKTSGTMKIADMITSSP